MRPGAARACLAFAVVASLAACELTEVAAPESADLLVVEAVLRAGSPVQRVILHRSIDGRMVRGEPGASVVVTTEGGREVRFSEAPIDDCVDLSSLEEIERVELQASCYLSLEFRIEPRASYTLEIRTSGGETVRGQTQVPGAFSFASPSIEVDPVGLSAQCRLPDRPFTLAWGQAAGAWAYVVTLNLFDWADPTSELPDPVELTSVSVSAADTSLLFPTNIGLFQRGDLDSRVFDILRAGLPSQGRSVLVVMATDRNYTNAIRGGRFNPSGNVRLSSVAGDGVGVFGSVVPITILSGGSGGSTPCPGVLPPEGR